MRTLFHHPEVNQINYLDNRYYTNDNGKTFFPSVTTILDVFPKGFGFDQWLKDVGSKATEIADRAAESGTKVHDATESLHKGTELTWTDKDGNPQYTLREWQMILKYMAFWKAINPELITNELSMCAPELKYGGTIDRVVMIGGVRWLLDVKTSNYLHKINELQLAAYAVMWNHFNPENPIEKTGIIWLNAKTRTSKIDIEKDVYQGEGWQIATFERHYTDAYKIFQHAQAIWQEENPNYKPLNLIYPDTISLVKVQKDYAEAVEKGKELKAKIKAVI